VRVAVTGAAGRIGTKVVALLIERGHSVVAIDKNVPDGHDGDDGHDGGDTADRADGGGGGRARPRAHWLAADVTDYYSLLGAFAGCDAVVHLAAFPGPGRAAEWAVHHNNVVSSYNALHAAASLGIPRICQASSVNAIGGAYSRKPRFDYFPLDEDHPSFNEDPYSLSKWICEQQAASIARRYDSLLIASLRLHMCVEDRDRALEAAAAKPETAARDLWGYTSLTSAAGACLLAIGAGYTGHEVFLIVAPDHVGPAPAMELAAAHYPDVPLRRASGPAEGFFNCAKAQSLLGWRHCEW
jgi:UDP-glucose 4-epimerase